VKRRRHEDRVAGINSRLARIREPSQQVMKHGIRTGMNPVRRSLEEREQRSRS
jgi:hypothetical protein